MVRVVQVFHLQVRVVRVVYGVQAVHVVQLVQVVQVVQVIRVDKVVSQDVMRSENTGFTWSKSSDYWEELRCHAFDGLTD